ncbi:hypothetical protein LWI29_005803 [Acer saccharum]|uniref:Uncharacterized protein n=1 Tax=Acer saccharum TaxID=4024 RepID=A0AA39SFV4_ACESA|nr:hypothetical protein LWI29_005803 [Acer saccharum]
MLRMRWMPGFQLSTKQEVVPSTEKEVAGSVLLSRGLRVGYDYASKEDQSIQHINEYMSLLAKRRESDPDDYRHSLILMSSEFYTKLNVDWKRIIEVDNKAQSSFDALAYEYLSDWIEYGCGKKPR